MCSPWEMLMFFLPEFMQTVETPPFPSEQEF